MSSPATEPAKPLVIRARSALVIVILTAIVVVALAVDAFARGDVLQTFLILPWMALILWGVYVVLFRPCVIVGPDGVHVVNVFRRHDVPWAAIAEITSRFQLTVHLTSGGKVTSWGATTNATERAAGHGGPSRVAGALGGFGMARGAARETGGVTSGRTRPLLDEFRELWPDAPEGSGARESGWDWWSLGVTLVLALLCLGSVLATL